MSVFLQKTDNEFKAEALSVGMYFYTIDRVWGT